MYCNMIDFFELRTLILEALHRFTFENQIKDKMKTSTPFQSFVVEPVNDFQQGIKLGHYRWTLIDGNERTRLPVANGSKEIVLVSLRNLDLTANFKMLLGLLAERNLRLCRHATNYLLGLFAKYNDAHLQSVITRETVGHSLIDGSESAMTIYNRIIAFGYRSRLKYRGEYEGFLEVNFNKDHQRVLDIRPKPVWPLGFIHDRDVIIAERL